MFLGMPLSGWEMWRKIFTEVLELQENKLQRTEFLVFVMEKFIPLTAYGLTNANHIRKFQK